jgi:hypothetical protein
MVQEVMVLKPVCIVMEQVQLLKYKEQDLELFKIVILVNIVMVLVKLLNINVQIVMEREKWMEDINM